MSEVVPVRVDKKGRLTIPADLRKELGVEPGDVFFLQKDSGVLRFAKAENPFDALARHAVKEHEAGRTISLEDWADREGVPLDK